MGHTGQDSLHSEIASLLAEVTARVNGLELDSLNGPALTDELVGAIRGIDTLNAALGPLARRWLDTGEWTSDGSKSASARLSRETGQSKTSCTRRLSTARAMAELPTVADAWAAGELSEDVVNLLTKARHHRQDYFDQDDNHLVELCTGLSYFEAQRAIRYWTIKVDEHKHPDGPAPIDEFLKLADTFDGAMSINGLLDPISGGIVKTALEQIEHELYLDDQRTGNQRSTAERKAAALVEMAIRATTAPADGKRPEPLITIICGETAFDRILELSTGTIITANLVVPHLSRSQIQSFVYNGMTPIAATNRRTFTGRLRRAIQIRDRRCQHPSGCDEPLNHCDLDHITPHNEGGVTEGVNGRLQCKVHNRNKQRHDARPTRDTTELVGTNTKTTRINDHIADARERRHDEELARARLDALMGGKVS